MLIAKKYSDRVEIVGNDFEEVNRVTDSKNIISDIAMETEDTDPEILQKWEMSEIDKDDIRCQVYNAAEQAIWAGDINCTNYEKVRDTREEDYIVNIDSFLKWAVQQDFFPKRLANSPNWKIYMRSLFGENYLNE